MSIRKVTKEADERLANPLDPQLPICPARNTTSWDGWKYASFSSSGMELAHHEEKRQKKKKEEKEEEVIVNFSNETKKHTRT